MYTVEITKKELSSPKNRLIVDAVFTNGKDTHTRSFEFPLYTTVDQIKKRLKEQIEEFEAGESLEPQVPTGTVDVSTIDTKVPQGQRDFNDWFIKFQRLERVNKLVDLGVINASNPKLLALVQDLKNTIKVEYIDQL